jgi:hypothetical protein
MTPSHCSTTEFLLRHCPVGAPVSLSWKSKQKEPDLHPHRIHSSSATGGPRFPADYPMPKLLDHLTAPNCPRLGSYWNRCGVQSVEPIEAKPLHE